MKQYIMGMITGGALILCAFMFMGNAQYNLYSNDDIYYMLSRVESMVDDIDNDVAVLKLSISYGVDCN